MSYITEFTDGVANVWSTIFGEIGDTVESVADTVGDTIEGAVESVTDTAGGAVESVTGVASGAIEGAQETAGNLAWTATIAGVTAAAVPIVGVSLVGFGVYKLAQTEAGKELAKAVNPGNLLSGVELKL
jgi:phage-related protein